MRRPLYKTFIFALITIATILGINYAGGHFIENIFFMVTRSIGGISYRQSQGVLGIAGNIFRINQILAENQSLREDHRKLISASAILQEVESENRALRTRLGLGYPSAQQLVLSNIFSVRGDQYASSFMIDNGSENGIEQGMAVVTAENMLVGIVTQVYNHAALVLTPHHPAVSLNVRVGSTVLARSKGSGDSAELELITSQETMKVDDLVVTAGLDKIPSGIPVFTIAEIKTEGGNLFKSVRVKQIFNAFDTRRVFVIIK